MLEFPKKIMPLGSREWGDGGVERAGEQGKRLKGKRKSNKFNLTPFPFPIH
jgi:hypothetical protein